MSKNENKQFPVIAIIISALAIVLSVIAIAFAAGDNYYGGDATLGILELVASVLFLAGLTTGKKVLARVISIISLVSMIITSFVLSVIKVYSQDVALLAISLLMLVASVLGLIYYLTSFRNPRIGKMFIATGFVLGLLVVMYAIFYISSDMAMVARTSIDDNPMTQNYFLLFGLAVISVIPAVIKVTTKDDEEVEANKEEE